MGLEMTNIFSPALIQVKKTEISGAQISLWKLPVYLQLGALTIVLASA